ncbi:PRC-barrel domain-containing protein [Clostridium formicaceticum]|uniref:PRC-barrel domain-containing protein n=1 Tax=Clostridium formicaceticum TaxID=1497 RepID=A0AAC9RNH2_9CLOT|nr:PRC-barrel domain-containing protein [Clostridium formicaceticum]AOY76997.1 hypothetical protein BJL90_14715 [Clostridium formicaceticum]ARE87485.1 hypothetical protein CLFO_18850 [Clostridium formicaceticum]
MIKGSEFIGLPIKRENEKMMDYRVKDLIYTNNGSTLLAFIIKSPKISNRSTKVVPFKKIKEIQREGLVISSENDIMFSHQVPEIQEALINPIKVIGFHIYNYHGELFGIIKDTIIEKKRGNVIALVISKGIIDDFVEGYSILPLVSYIEFQQDRIFLGDHELNTLFLEGGGLKKLLGIE